MAKIGKDRVKAAEVGLKRAETSNTRDRKRLALRAKELDTALSRIETMEKIILNVTCDRDEYRRRLDAAETETARLRAVSGVLVSQRNAAADALAVMTNDAAVPAWTLIGAVCVDPDCTIKPKPGYPMHGPHTTRAG